MKTLMKYIGSALAFLLLLAPAAIAQEELPAVIKKDMSLSGGEYIVTNTTVTENATLTIDNETVLLFALDAFIHVKGGLVMKGEDNAFITVKSGNAESQGIGFVFSGNSDKKVNIDHVRFSHIRKPLEFERNWLRDEVHITNNVFKNLNNNRVPIEIKSADQILINKPLTVNIKSNTFSNNYSSILLTNVASKLLNYEVHNNVISQNMYFGADQNGIFTSPMFVNYDRSSEANEPSFKNNSFTFNFTSHLDEENITFYEPFLHAIGTGEKIDLGDNYIGNQSDADLAQILKDIQAEQEAPVVDVTGRATQPSDKLNGHVYLVSVNDSVEPTNPFTVAVDENLVRLTLTANRPVQASKYYKIQYRYMKDDTIYIVGLNHKLSYTNVYKNIILDIDDRTIKANPNGYIVVDGFYDINGYDVPAVTIGMYQFIQANRDYIMFFENLAQIPKKFLIQIDPPEVDPIDIDSNEIISAQKDSVKDKEIPYPYKWDAGVFLGSTVYFGDLATTGIQFYIPNTRPNLGLRLGYRFNEHFRIELAQNSMIIVGDDRQDSKVGKNRGTDFERGLSFRTTVVDMGLNFEYQILKYKTTSTIVPSLMVGINGFWFKPEGKYNETYYDLREIGTEGQVAKGAETYPEWSYGIPFGIKLSRHINKRNIIAVSYTHNKIFTDYLDDVSTGHFQTSDFYDDVSPTPLRDYTLSNPNGLSGPRSYSAAYDAFAYWGFTWLYRF